MLTATDGIYNVNFEAAGAPTSIIFNNGKDGEEKVQTADLAFEDGAVYNSQGKLNTYTATFTTDLGWDNVYAYVWSGDGTTAYNKALGEWGGTEITATDGKYVVRFLANNAPEKIIFHNNQGEQTTDLAFEDGKAYSWKTYAVTFNNTSNWDAVYAYPFTNSTADDKAWPGTELTADEGVYSYSYIGAAAPEYIIFNNGNGGEGNQTADLIFEDGAVYNAGGAATVTKSITAAGYATYCSASALDFSSATGLTAYIAKIDADNKVTFTPVTKVPANTGVLLKGEAGEYTISTTTEEIDAVTDNALVGVATETKVAAGAFVLMNGTQGVGFYKTTKEFTVGANTAYIPALASTEARFIGFDGEATGVQYVATESHQNGEVYNLQGQRVITAKKGLYIMNGKKVLVK